MERIPILKFGTTLIVTIQTELHDRTANTLQEDILSAIQKHHAHAVIIDVSAVEIVDSFIGRMLSNTAEMAALMDASVVLVGISPAVAITLVELGLDLGDVRTSLNLESAVELLNPGEFKALGSAGLTAGLRTVPIHDPDEEPSV